MKFLIPLLILAVQARALETAAVTAVASKFGNPSPEEQYNARVELNRLIDDATAPGKNEHAAVTRALCAVLQNKEIPREARKYILRAMTRVATADAVDCLAAMLNGDDALLKEEARQVLESIHDLKAIAALESALRKAADKREKLPFAGSLAVQRADSAVPLLAALAADPDVETARAGLDALAEISGDPAVAALKQAYAEGKVTPAARVDLERALLVASSGDGQVARELYQTTGSDTVRLAAFTAMMTGGENDAAMIEQAVKSEHAGIRRAALACGIEMKLPSLESGLAQAMEQMPVEERMVVLANIHHLNSKETAGKIALSRVAADDEHERVAAIMALGRIGTRPAFDAVLQALGDRRPPVNQAAASALAGMDYPEAGAALLARLQGDSSEDKILAIKALQFRHVPGANAFLMEIIASDDPAASKEAMKALYFIATLDDLRAMCAKATATADAARRKSLASICSRIASRINTDEARALLKPLD
jgi:HEAT repeat protein